MTSEYGSSKLKGIANITTSETGGMYRYQGTGTKVTNNYICFGTSDKTTCTGNTDSYMYRIIGVDSTGKLKLLKNKSISFNYWADKFNYDYNWNTGIMKNMINGSAFLTNSTYVPSGWSNKIATVYWKYGDISASSSGACQSSSKVYNIENSWTNKVSSKIGLMYLHDFYYSYGNISCLASCSSSYSQKSFSNNCEDSWAIDATISQEWTISRVGGSSNYFAWQLGWKYITSNYTSASAGTRPVFYLTSDIKITGGTGTSTDPYIIS